MTAPAPSWTDWVSAIGAVASLIIAIAALAYTRWLAIRTQRDIVSERREVFELAVLRDLLDSLDGPVGTIGPDQYARVAMLRAPELPTWRFLAASGDDSAAVAAELDRQLVPAHAELVWRLRFALRADIQQAVARRVDSGGALGWSRSVLRTRRAP